MNSNRKVCRPRDGAPRDSKSAFTRVHDALCVAGTPLRGPITAASGIWVPAFAGTTAIKDYEAIGSES
jgi:hypothetical protein